MTAEKGLVRVVNALEGYRLELHNPELQGEARGLLEKLYHDTLVTGKVYGLPLDPFERWLKRYLSDDTYTPLRRGWSK